MKKIQRAGARAGIGIMTDTDRLRDTMTMMTDTGSRREGDVKEELKRKQEKRAEEIIKEAEKGKAKILRPTGYYSFNSKTAYNDDEFFNFASHVPRKL